MDETNPFLFVHKYYIEILKTWKVISLSGGTATKSVFVVGSIKTTMVAEKKVVFCP